MNGYTYEVWEDGCCIHEDHYFENDTYEDAQADAEEYICDMIDNGYDADPEDFEIRIFLDGEEII